LLLFVLIAETFLYIYIYIYILIDRRNLGCGEGHDFAGGFCEEPGETLSGLGECAWCIADGMEGFSAIAVNARRFDAAYVAGESCSWSSDKPAFSISP
jgi:hypothetical protein